MNVMNFSKQEIIEILRDDSKNEWLLSLANIAVYDVKTKI